MSVFHDVGVRPALFQRAVFRLALDAETEEHFDAIVEQLAHLRQYVQKDARRLRDLSALKHDDVDAGVPNARAAERMASLWRMYGVFCRVLSRRMGQSSQLTPQRFVISMTPRTTTDHWKTRSRIAAACA